MFRAKGARRFCHGSRPWRKHRGPRIILQCSDPGRIAKLEIEL
jgi:hypothetical protein